jgi:hypothetical protein
MAKEYGHSGRLRRPQSGRSLGEGKYNATDTQGYTGRPMNRKQWPWYAGVRKEQVIASPQGAAISFLDCFVALLLAMTHYWLGFN